MEDPLSAADQAQLAQWVASCSAAPGTLPDKVVPVQGRLIRAVGLGQLPDRGSVYLKVMGFPRPKDRLRYLVRALPAIHESRVLRHLAGLGIRCPEVLLAHGERRAGRPHLSLLVTAALPVRVREVPIAEVATLAARLAAVGVFHPDLNQGNFVPLEDGNLAVLDLQSARLRRAPLALPLRLKMAAKLVSEATLLSSTIEQARLAVVAAGLVPPASAKGLQSMVNALRRRFMIKRILRCLEESTEFHRERHFGGVLHRRRIPLQGGTWYGGGRELLRLWIGDRAKEVLKGDSHLLIALFLKSRWLPGKHRVYISDPEMAQQFATVAHELLEGYAQFQRICRGDEDAPPRA